MSQCPRIFTLLLVGLLAAGAPPVAAATKAAEVLPAPYFAAPRSDPAHEPPAGYYDTGEGLIGEQLKDALHRIIRGHIAYPYSSSSTDTWDILKDADRDPNNPDNVWLVYNGASVNGAQEYNGGAGWNREHVWPQSLGGFTTGTVAGTDAHNLRACHEQVNSRRGSLEFDYGGSPLTIQGLVETYADGDSFESNNSYKGDLARMIFYMAVRYEGGAGEPDLEVDDFTNRGTGTFGKMSLLLAWHLLDPVDDFERRRNARVYAYQGNRNPFIDRPDWVHAVFDPNYAPPDFVVEPEVAVSVSGLSGGPFEPLQHVYSITAGEDSPLDWVVSVNVPWLFASPTAGLADPGVRADLTVFVNAAALPTDPGSYVGAVRFQNKVTGAVLVRQIVANILTPARLAVSPSTSQTLRGPVGGPFVPAAWQYLVSNTGITPMEWSASGPAWLDVSVAGGSLDPGQAVTVVVEPNATAAAQAEGSYDGTLEFTNLTNGDGNTPRAVRLEAGTRDYFTRQFTTAAPFNLANKSVMFTPNGSADFYRATSRVVSVFPVNPAGGTPLALGDDASASVTAPVGSNFSFFGASYPQVYVGSNGYLTFGSADATHSESLTNHFVRARISALFEDLNPAAAGSVSWRQLSDRVALTWQGVPTYGSGGANSFQIELFFDGRLRITWLGVTSATGVVGLSRGTGVPGDFVASDFASYPADALAVESFSPPSGGPGIAVTIEGPGLDAASEVLFGGVPAVFNVVDPTRIEAVVPAGAMTGAITVLAGGVESESTTDFVVAVTPTVPAVATTLQALSGFQASGHGASAAQTFFVSGVALPGPLVISAPAGFEVSLDGVNFAATVQVEAPARTDEASRYGGLWETGSQGGSGFGPWSLSSVAGSGSASAFTGDPGTSGVTGMASAAFGLQASPEDSGAYAAAARSLVQPLAVGEALSFDWGINWDSNSGLKGFEILSDSTVLVTVRQNGFPGPVMVYNTSNPGGEDAGLTYGTEPMRWAFRQLDTGTLRVTATSRQGGREVVFTRDLAVPGAVSGFQWFASAMEPDVRRYSFFDQLAIEPVAPGGGALASTAIQVRLAEGVPGEMSGQVSLSSGGQSLAIVQVSGSVSGSGGYDDWLLSHGLDPAAPQSAPEADADGDQFTNGQEYAFGTNPRNVSSSLLTAEPFEGNLVVTWLERSDVTYAVQSSESLAATVFKNDGTVTVENGPSDPAPPVGYMRKRFTVPASGSKFYRVTATAAP